MVVCMMVAVQLCEPSVYARRLLVRISHDPSHFSLRSCDPIPP